MERDPLFERQLLVELVVKDGVSVAEAARAARMSRQKAHKWLRRFHQGGLEALEDASRARNEVERFDGAIADRILELRRRRPTWGPRTLIDHLALTGMTGLPAASTVGQLLKRHQLIEKRAPRVPSFAPFRLAGPTPVIPNARWTQDFKGQFPLQDGTMCFPYTLRDAASRMVLAVEALTSTHSGPVQRILERRMRKYGLPEEIQSDGGTPFATRGLAQLSRLSVWLMKLGVVPVLSRPGKPQDNGAHERMHLDLKKETALPPARNARGQQRKFDSFIDIYNYERPHHALDGDVPGARWNASPREFPSRIREPEYPAWWEVRKVNGASFTFSWHDEAVKMNDALGGETLGFEPFDDGLHRVHFYGFVIGILDERGSRPRLLGISRERGRLETKR